MRLTNSLNSAISSGPARLLAIMLLAAATTAGAATVPALTGRVLPRPVTPGDKTIYGLPPSTEVSGGLTTVGVGTPVYLEADVNSAIAASDIQGVTWTLTSRPIGSSAALASNPLTASVPVYEPADRVIYQVAGRTLLRPDMRGQYTISANIATGGSGSTNVTVTITAGVYMGVQVCETCHSGGSLAPDMFHSWSTTAHASIFTQGINGALGSYSQSCLPCHTTGYDLNTNAVNGGFDDVAALDHWIFPAVLSNSNWASMPLDLQHVANITCENCHGPGSEHAYLFGNTNAPTWPGLTVTVNSGDCNQCHDAPTHHVKGTEWYTSLHALASRVPSGSASRAVCVGCHTSNGFIGRMNGDSTTNTDFAALGCQTCHEPHGLTMPTNNPHLLRALGSYIMPDGTTVTNAGNGSLCLECHHSRNGSVTNMLVNFPQGKPNWVGGSSFGVHDSPQGDMIEGINAVTYGQNIPSSAHRYTVTNLCVGCHMQAVGTSDPAFLLAGGHTFHMTYSVVNNGVTNVVDKVDACVQCHGPIASFDLPRDDYNGDGIIEGVQTEVQHLLDKLSTMLPNSAYVANGNYVADGLVKSSLSFKTNWSAKFLQAGYNWQFVNNDGSKGVHNAPFAVGLIKASIADLTGDANNDGLPDAWQIQYFGSVTNPAAAPNYSAAGDGVPNWMKYALGLNPMVPGVSTTNGVVWANVTAIGDTNTVHIYTAAEVAFDTEAGKTYQVQSISSLSDGWQNIGGPIAGTGSTISYVTPTRQNAQQFYRVAHTP